VPVSPKYIDWDDERLRVSVTDAAELMGVSWYAARELMVRRELPARAFGRKSQPYYRTSLKHIREFMRATKKKRTKKAGAKS
jgi:hypothetical protein